MRRALAHRQCGQTIAFAAVAMVAIVGALAIVVDTGIFLVIQRQFQTAADAGALAGAWHDPICPYGLPCQSSPKAAPLPPTGAVVGTPPGCVSPPPVTVPPTPKSCAPCAPGFTACDVALANAATVGGLCSGPIQVIVATGTTLFTPNNVNTIVVIVKCDAGYSFGRILNLSTKTLWASAAASLGDRTATLPTCTNGGDIASLTPPPAPCGYIARLID